MKHLLHELNTAHKALSLAHARAFHNTKCGPHDASRILALMESVGTLANEIEKREAK